MNENLTFMKKFIAVLLFCACSCAVACDEDSQLEIWTVAPEKGVAGIFSSYGYVPAYIVRRTPTADWELFTGTIEGFTMEPGTQSVIRVRIDKLARPMADGPSHCYTMEHMISRTPSDEDFSRFDCEEELLIASEDAARHIGHYWIQTPSMAPGTWQILGSPIEGFDYIAGYEYRVRVRISCDYSPRAGAWSIAYTLLEQLSCERKDSEGLPE